MPLDWHSLSTSLIEGEFGPWVTNAPRLVTSGPTLSADEVVKTETQNPSCVPWSRPSRGITGDLSGATFRPKLTFSRLV